MTVIPVITVTRWGDEAFRNRFGGDPNDGQAPGVGRCLRWSALEGGQGVTHCRWEEGGHYHARDSENQGNPHGSCWPIVPECAFLSTGPTSMRAVAVFPVDTPRLWGLGSLKCSKIRVA